MVSVGRYKRAIIDPADQTKFEAAIQTDAERVPLTLMLWYGLHPANIIRLTKENLVRRGNTFWLEFKRAKNRQPRTEALNDEFAEKLLAWIADPTRPHTRHGLWDLTRRVGDRAGLAEVSPMTLRHTACMNFLRKNRDHNDRIFLVAAKMGCSVEVVAQNYTDLEAWEAMK